MRRSPGSWWGTRTGDTGRTLVVRVADRCAVDWLTVRLRRMVLRTLVGGVYGPVEMAARWIARRKRPRDGSTG